jgi:5-formyltetrahydrofolate cyclo-ligase
VVAGLAAWLAAHRPGRVLTFLAMPGELDCSRLATDFPEIEWTVTRTPPEGPLTVHPLASEMESHRYGFPQPVAGSFEVDPADVDAVLVPGLAFDDDGNRLGHGAGYYDELLGRVRPGADRIGVTLERFVVDRVPVVAHDRPVGWLATELGVRRAGGSPAP